jgi:hypothetical protein
LKDNSEQLYTNTRQKLFNSLIDKANDLKFKTERALLVSLTPIEREHLQVSIEQIEQDIILLEHRRDNLNDSDPIPSNYPFPNGMSAEQFNELAMILQKYHSQTNQYNTNGGDINFSEGGSIIKAQGDISFTAKSIQTGSNSTIIENNFSIEDAYNVQGLSNPYLGLQAFTYNDKNKYAGRQSYIPTAIDQLTNPPITLLFVTGVSGSGKSSFAQAGLLPALESYWQKRYELVKSVVFRPSQQPMLGLEDALQQLSLNPSDWQKQFGNSEDFENFMSKRTPANQINLLIIDQFEEVFTQSQMPFRKMCKSKTSFSGDLERLNSSCLTHLKHLF